MDRALRLSFDEQVDPRGGELLPACSVWRDKEYRFDVVVSARLAERLRRSGWRLDLLRGEFVSATGERHDVLRGRGEFEEVAGEPAPAWVFRWPSAPRPFVVPRGRLDLDEDSESGALTFTPPQSCVPIFRCLTAAYLGPTPRYADDGFAPLSGADWRPARESLMSDVDLVAPNGAAADLARAAFIAVCARGAALWLLRRPARFEQKHDVGEVARRLLDAMAQGHKADDGLLREAHTLLGDEGDNDAATLRALLRLQRHLRRQLLPIELVVVPRGKHFSALPEARGLGADLRGPQRAVDENGVACESQQPFHSATVIGAARRVVFLPEDDLEDMQISSRHELYHLLEDPLLSEAQRMVVASSYSRTVGTAGPFVRPYGYLRQEFFPTMGEAFEGAYGESGQDWLRREHTSLHALLCELTGRG